MKTYRTIDDAIYKIANEKIVKRRRNPAAAMIVSAAGLAVMGIGYFGGALLAPALSSGMIIAGSVMAVAGIAKTIVDLSDKGRPYYKPNGEKLRRYVLIFDTPYRMKVCQCVNDGDLDALTGLPHGKSPSVVAVIYKTAQNDIAMTQVFVHESRECRPLTETKIFEKGQFTLTRSLA